jgi:hypothetical protein
MVMQTIDQPHLSQEGRVDADRRMRRIVDGLVQARSEERIPYWARFVDDRGVGHFAFVTDPEHALVDQENAQRRQAAVVAFDRAIERYQQIVDELP